MEGVLGGQLSSGLVEAYGGIFGGGQKEGSCSSPDEK